MDLRHRAQDAIRVQRPGSPVAVVHRFLPDFDKSNVHGKLTRLGSFATKWSAEFGDG